LCALKCGRSRHGPSAKNAAIRAMFRSSAAASRTRAGVVISAREGNRELNLERTVPGSGFGVPGSCATFWFRVPGSVFMVRGSARRERRLRHGRNTERGTSNRRPRTGPSTRTWTLEPGTRNCRFAVRRMDQATSSSSPRRVGAMPNARIFLYRLLRSTPRTSAVRDMLPCWLVSARRIYCFSNSSRA
jgi:hypothetical protein